MRKLAGAIGWLLLSSVVCLAGGPLYVGGPNLGNNGEPFLWNIAGGPVQYRTDGGPLSRTSGGTIVIDHAGGIARVQSMFQVWQDVPTSDVAFNRAGDLLPVTGFTDGDVSTVTEFDRITAPCNVQNPATPAQTAIIFDANGAIMQDLTGDPFVIGVTFACQLNDAGHIVSAVSVLNGTFQDGVDSGFNFEIPAAEFDEAFTHEFGHLIGLDHAQANVDLLNSPFPCDEEPLRGLPLMFPFLVCQARVSAGLPRLAPDDVAIVSKLYPNASFNANYGILRGTIYFSDGLSGAQGVNVVARAVDNPLTPENESRRVAFSAVSGYLFTGNPGQSITGTNTGGSDFGSRIVQQIGYFEMALPPGDYTLEVESVNNNFFAGSSVGPLNPPIPNPGVHEFWDAAESYFDNPAAVTPINIIAGATVTRDIILNGTPPRFDRFEDEAALPRAYHGGASRGGR
jgi:hypothetical protein